MTEPTVQVPVSLIERIRRDYSVKNLGPNIVDALDALLSQPTPTAEPDVWADIAASVDRKRMSARQDVAPPSIAEMVPGTKLWCELGRVTVERDASGRWGLRTFTGYLYDPADIDPSTIRNVTPPKEQS